MIMTRLIDADKLLEIYKKWVPQLSSKEDEGDRRGVETCIAVLEDMPTMDAVEVVRCRDCKYFKTWLCQNEDSHDDWFCADGERKEDDG